MAITNVIKGAIGDQDINFDNTGTGQEFSRKDSNGQTFQLSKINSDHIPLATQVRTDSGTSITSLSAALSQALLGVIASGTVDGVTLEVVGGVLRVKALGISAAQLNADSVITAKILNSNVTTAKIADLAILVGKLANDAVETAKIKNDAVTTAKIINNAITLAKMADNSVGIDEFQINASGGSLPFYPAIVGEFTLPGGATSIAVTISGAIVGDTVQLTPKTAPVGGALLSVSVTAPNTITVVHPANESNQYQYAIFRATSA